MKMKKIAKKIDWKKLKIGKVIMGLRRLKKGV